MGDRPITRTHGLVDVPHAALFGTGLRWRAHEPQGRPHGPDVDLAPLNFKRS